MIDLRLGVGVCEGMSCWLREYFWGLSPKQKGREEARMLCRGMMSLCPLSPRKETPKYSVVKGRGCSKPTHAS